MKISQMTLAAAALSSMEVEVNDSGITKKINVQQLKKGASVQYGKILFVDVLNGDDDTGTKGYFDLPYKTKLAAQTAASSGDTIMVFPGNYDEIGLGKDGVNWYTLPGVKNYINSALYTGNNLTFNIFGYEQIFPYGALEAEGVDAHIFDFIGDSVVNIQIGGYENYFGGLYGLAGDNAVVNLTSLGRIYSEVHPNSNFDCYGDAVINVTAPEIYWNAGAYTHGSGSPRITATATNRHVFKVPIADAGVVAPTCVYNDGGTVIFNGDVIAYDAPFSSYALFTTVDSTGITIVNGKIHNGTSYASTTHRIVIAQAGVVELNGMVTGFRMMTVVSGTLHINKGFALDNSTFSTVNQLGGVVTANNAYCANLNNSSSAHVFEKSGGDTIFRNCTAYVTNSGAVAVRGLTPQTVRCQPMYSNTVLDYSVLDLTGFFFSDPDTK